MSNGIELSQKERESLIRTIIMNSIFIVGCLLVIEFFAFSNYDDISSKADAANSAIEKMDSYKNQGVSFEQYKSLVNTYQSKKSKFDDTETALISEVLKKDPNSSLDYISWVEQEVSSGSLLHYDEVEKKNDSIIGNILPTLSDSESSDTYDVQKNIVTLGTLTRYIEESLLKKYSLDSTSPISIGDVTYDSAKDSTVNIGSFLITIEASGKNSSILNVIDAIQNSGKLSVNNGQLVSGVPVKEDQVYSGLSNLLIGIESIESKTALSKNDMSNSVSLKLRFFVKGRSYGTFLEIKNLVIDKYSKTKANIASITGKYKGQAPKTDTQMDALSDVRNLSNQIDLLSKNIEDIQKSGKVTEYAGQFNSLLSTYSSLKAIESKLEKDTAVLK